MRRWAVGLVAAAGFAATMACDPAAMHLYVNQTTDGVDAVPGNGICEMTNGSGDCSLRAAIMEANATPGFDNIYLVNATTYTLSLAGAGEDAGATGDLDITDSVTIRGVNVTDVPTIHAAGIDRVFDVRTGTLLLINPIVRGGVAPSGAGIRVNTGTTVSANGAEIRNNAATAGPGGIELLTGSSSYLNNATVAGNTGTTAGGIGGPGGIVARQSTISGNLASTGTGGLGVGAASQLIYTTVANNAGVVGGVSGPVDAFANAIDSSSGPDCSGLLTSSGYNVVSDATCVDGTVGGDVPNATVALGPLANNGGLNRTHLPGITSDAVDHIPGAQCAATGDQRFSGRPVNTDCDAGSVEVSTQSLVVNVSGDAVDALPGDGLCQDLGGIPGDCSLRAAIHEANTFGGPGNITINPLTSITLGLAGAGENANATGDLDVTDTLTIDGNGSSVSANLLDRVFDVRSGTVAISDLGVFSGSAGDGAGGGGIISRAGTVLELERVEVGGNQLTVDSQGGGAAFLGTATVVDSTFNGNAAHSAGEGGAIALGANATFDLRGSLIMYNYGGQQGGGLYASFGQVITIENTTFVGNQADSDGGGIAIQCNALLGACPTNAPTTVINSSAIVGNTASFGVGGGIQEVTGASTTLRNSVVGDNFGAGCDIAGTVASGGHNYVDCALSPTGTGDTVGSAPMLDPLGFNGGPTQTMLPQPGSPLIDTGDPGTPGTGGTTCAGTDARGFGRGAGGDRCDRGPVELPDTLSLTVNHGGDAVDSNVLDGVCQDQGGAPGDCSLRAAILQTNAWVGTQDTIAIDGSVNGVTLSGPDTFEDAGLDGDLDITDPVAIAGNGSAVDAAGRDRAFHVLAPTGTTSVISNMTITGGVNADGQGGGGVLAQNGGLDLERVTISGNDSTTADGGALESQTVDTVELRQSTLSGNRGVYSTVATYNTGTVSLIASTVTANETSSTYGALDGWVGPISLHGTIVADQITGPSCFGTILSSGYNVASDATCGLAATGDLQNATAKLSPLLPNGAGPMRTHLPAAFSPAADTVPSGTPVLCDGTFPTDQRGLARPSGGACEKGSVEIDPSYAGLSLFVNNGVDDVDSNPGNGVCQDQSGAPGQCSLRAAIMEANRHSGIDTVNLIGPTVNLSRVGSVEDAGATGDLDITDHVIVVGNNRVVDANDLDRVFDIGAGVGTPTVLLGNMTVRDGTAPGAENGGGILVRGEGSTLQTTGVTVTLNESVSNGGGIYVLDGEASIGTTTLSSNTAANGAGLAAGGTASVVVDRSTVSANTATSDASALLAQNDANLQVTMSTLSGNNAFYSVVGLWDTSDMSLRQATITKNSSVSNYEAVANYGSGSFTMAGSILADQVTGASCVGGLGPTSGGYNHSSDTSCLLAGTGDVQGTSPALGALLGNGGLTRTHLPISTSPVVNTIPNGTANLCDAFVATDQRGQARPSGGACEKGAVEVNPAFVGLSLTVNNAGDAVDSNPGNGTCQNQGGGAGQCSLRAAIMEANARGGADTITIGAGINPSLSLAGSAEDAGATGDLDVTDHLTINGGGATVNANDLDRVLHIGAAGQTPTVSIVSLTMTNGTAPNQPGGAVYVTNTASVLVLNSSTLSASSSGVVPGGGLAVIDGTVTATSTTISGNSASDGGGIVADGAANVTITNSTISGNTATYDGSAIYTTSAAILALQQSTVSGNTAQYSTIVNASVGNLTVVLSTVTANTSTSSTGALARYNTGLFTFRGSVVADQVGGTANCVANPNRPTSLGYNVVSTGCGWAQPGDVQNVAGNLAALANNGGTTLTHLPNVASPAVNTIPNGTAGLCDGTYPTDQRGTGRPNGAACDKGAVER